MRAVEAYFRAYGPATPDHVRYWLGEGLGVRRKRIQSWITDSGSPPRPPTGFGGREDAHG